MDQVAPGSELAHHDSPRNNTNTNSSNASSNNELLTLLRNFISQSGDFRSVQPPSTAAIVGPNAFAAAAVNIVDPGDLVEPEPESEPQLDSIHPNNHHINHHHHHPQASSSSSNLTDSDPDSQATQAQQREELNEEDLERYSEEIDQHFIQSVTNAEEQSIFLREELIRPNNICKTINDINNNNSSIINTAQQQKLQQQQDQREMPQQNTLLETALTMSNITSSASGSVAAPGGDYVIPGSVGIQHQQQHQQQTQGNFQMQTWDLDNLGSVQCDNSPYMGGVGVGVGAVGGRQPFPSDGLGPGFTNPGMDDGYLQGPYAGQSQFNMQSHDQQQQQQQQQTMLGGQLLHGSQYAMQEYQTAISMPPSRANDIVTPSHVKASQYQQNMAYNTASRSLSHSHNNNNNPTLLTTDSMSSVPYQDFIKAPQLPLPGGQGGQGRRSDSGSEESVGEDRRGEKKLTTTPIPSDAEKTSGSNSSSGSHDDSPSPGIQGPVSSSSSSIMQDASSSGFAQQHMGSDFCHMVNSSLGETFTSNEMLLNEENLINSIPLPDSVVEIDEGCLEYQNAPTHNSSNNGGGSSALAPKVASASKLGGVAGTAATWASSEPKGSVDKQYASVGGDSWSVRKEKRKRRLHKKHKKSKAQHEGDASPTESLHDSEGARDDDRQYRQKHKTHRHSNASSTAGSEGPQMVADSSGANPSPNYSSMIPKTTADPIGLGKSSSGKSKHGSGSSSSRKDKSERKQEKAKKKQQQHQQWAAESAAVVSKPNGHHEHKLIAPASLQVPVNKGASYSAKQDGPTHATADSSAVQRWQTVTAIRDPKLPPMLSEMDRIPKRGRPSKKMKEMNLKFKPNGAEVAASAATKAPTPQTEAKPVTSTNKVVSMYTINDKGFIEVLNHKPKENRRSRERAEAFRNMLDEISKKTSIQKKTAGAKEVVGAFKQNGVRTRNQASTGPAADESGKKKRSRAAKGGKLFGGAASGETASVSAPSDASKDEDGMYTFSELAKHYKISNSILYRALEQSQRSMNNVRSKPKRGARKKAQKVGSEAKKAIGEFQPRQKEQANKKPEVRSVAEKKVAEPGIAIENSQKPDKPQPLVPIASELQENRPDAVEEPFATSDKSKRKKKKKKHKKERHEEGRKSKKSKEKKKKKKERLHLQQEREKAKSKEEESIHIVPSVVPVSNAAPIAKKKMSSKSGSSSSSLESISTGKRPESFSSISGEDEDNAYDGGDSSSDVDPPPASSSSATASSCQLKSVDAMSSPIASPSMLPSVFGSGLTSSQMPSFQGIKEFGGLSQFSEHTRKIEETHDAKLKRHKHKKKKLVRRKNAADPNFLFNMEELSRQLARSCISASLPFLQRSSMGVENAFARNFVVAQNAPAVKAAGIEDSRSYRDPSKNRKAKRAPFPPSGDLQHHRQRFSSKQLNRVSIFCRSEFFVEHGYVQPYSGDSPLGLLKGFYPPKSSATAKQTTVPTEQQLKIDAPSNAKNSTKLTQESNKTKPGLAAREQQQLRHLSESDSDLASNSSRKASRKRGWPLGKPRGPRAKKPSLDETPPAPAPPTRLPGDAREKRTTQSAGQAGFVTGVKPTSATVTANSSNSHDKLNMNEGSPSTDQAGDKAQVSEDLVNHIKAAITARLDSAQVRTDILAKTVDSAVAEYLKKVSGESRPLDKKPRGRPPKNSKATQDVATPSSVSSSTSPAASEKPKKFWASKHRDGAAVRVGVVKKRGPGRPRKSNGLKTAQGAASLAPISRRANASIAPSAIRPNVAAAITKRKLLAKSSKLVVKSLASAKKRNAAVRKPAEPASSHITVNRAKAAVGSLLVGKSLRQQSGSAAWLAATNVPEPGMYHGRAADRHMDEAIESTVRKSSSLSTQSSSDGFHPESPTKAGVAVVKKSLESVVARLKRKQSSVDGEPDAESERNENHNNNVQRSSGGHRRGRGESHKDFYSSDAVPRKKMRVGSEEDLSDVFYPNSSCDLLGRPIAERHVLPEERKAFLTVGLFSAAFKMGSDDVMDAEDESSSSSQLLPPPSHAGLFLRKATRDFQLPYDIWWMYNQKRIHARQDPATRFVKIDANVYVDTQPSSDQEEHICVCKTLSDIHHSSSSSSQVEGCGKECLNRLMYIECSPETCPCGKMCGNRSIQNKQWCSELERFRTADRGWGVKTNGQISEGDFILEYVGEVVSDREFRRRTIENYNAHSDHYCIQLEAGKVIDGYRMANEGRFVNHSCQPNCEMQKWVVKGEYRIGLFAKKLIAPGEELTYDYNFHAYNLDRQQLCRCGAKECRGVIGGKTQKVYSEGHLHSARAGKAGIKGADAGRVRTSKAPLHNDSEEFCGNNIQRIDSQQIPLLSNEERRFVRAHRLFLHRNLRQMAPLVKLRQLREGDKPLLMQGVENDRTSSDKDALLESAITDVFTAVMTCKDENGISVAIPFINLPSKLQNPEYYQHVTDPVDLNFVEQKLVTKQYKKFDEFCSDVSRVFRSAEKYHGRKSTLGRDVARLRKAFTAARNTAAARLGDVTDKSKKKHLEAQRAELAERRRNSDFIRCICGIYKDEGVMIQCEKCYVWQHCDCMSVLPADYNDQRAYLCDECDEREVPVEVPVVPQPPSAPPGHTYYLTLTKDDLVIKQGDCVRLIHDHCLRQRSSSNPPVRTSYRLQSHSTVDALDFFRIKKLWTDDNGDKFAYGHHFLRPQDVRHDDSHLFFPNELIATPLHEIVPLEAVVSTCCVMDVDTFCMGRPKGVKEADVYICEQRCGNALKVVGDITKSRYPIYTKSHVFDEFPVRLAPPVRDYQVPDQMRRTQARRTQWLKATQHGVKTNNEPGGSGADEEEERDVAMETDADKRGGAEHSLEQESVKGGTESDAEDEEAVEGGIADSDDMDSDSGHPRNVKQKRLNGILSKLIKDASSRHLQVNQDA